MGYQSFKELKVWQEAKGLAVLVYKITAKGLLSKDYGLKDQLQRCAVSIPSNIAEGYERNSDKEFIRFLLISKGSIAELITQSEIAHEIYYIDSNELKEISLQCNKIGAMLTKLTMSRK